MSSCLSEQFDTILRSRLLAMLLQLATRKDAAAAAGRAAGEVSSTIFRPAIRKAKRPASTPARPAMPCSSRSISRRSWLRSWPPGRKTAEYPQTWKRALAYLQAELGKLDEAAALLQTLIADDALSAADYRALAGWQQALGRREQHDAALLSTYEQLNEYQLRDIVRRHLAPWERSEGPTPGAIDPELFVALKALFAKANDPRDHVYHVRQFYEASRDFRLLAALADAVIGQSAQTGLSIPRRAAVHARRDRPRSGRGRAARAPGQGP